MKTGKSNLGENEVSMRKNPGRTIFLKKWKAKISLVLVFTLAIFLCQGLYVPNEAQAAIPAYRASGTFTSGTAAITPPYPASMLANDVCLLVVESENQAITLSNAQGFAELTTIGSPQSAGTAAVDPGSRLAVFWKRTVGGDTAPTVTDPGDHATGQIHCFSGVVITGNPWDVGAGGNDTAANDTTGNIPGATTTVANTLVVLINTTSNNATSTTNFSAWTNAALATITERTDNSNTTGLGGGHGMATGEKATAGAYGTTTVTLAATSYKGAMSIALKPEPGILQFTSATFSVAENVASVNLTVSRTLGSEGAVSVQCANAGTGTATGGGTDYTMTSPQTLNWANGDTADKNCTVSISNDAFDEANETVNALLQSATGGATIGAQSTTQLTITDDDPTPSLSINDVTLAEGNSGATTFTFTVTLSAASGQTVTVDYATADGTATTADNDYVGIGTTTLTYTPGQTTKAVNVTVNGDTIFEPNETFNVNLSNATNATISDNQGIGTINNDDAGCVRSAPTLDLSPNSGTVTTDGGNFVYTLTITNNDTGCAAETFNLSKTDSNSTNFNASVLSQPSIVLASGASDNTITVTVSAISGQTTGTNNTYVTAASANHANQNSDTVATNINIVDPLLHNSLNTSSIKWAPNGWGIAGGKYGEITCETCHVRSTTNIKRVKDTVITAPNSPIDQFPGEIGSIAPLFSRISGSLGDPGVMGDDISNSPRASSNKICEVCHTYDGTAPYDAGVNAHPYSVGVALPNHKGGDAADCVSCHKHNKGFKASCDTCHGNPPGALASIPNTTGSVTTGAHTTHVTTLGFTECNNCHNGYMSAGKMPETSTVKPGFADITIGFSNFGSTTGTYTGQSNVSYNNVLGTGTKTCSTNYCHGGSINPVNSPVWDGAVVCGDCHKNTNADPPAIAAHLRHAESGTYAAGTKQGLNVLCTDCHGATAGASGHVNGDVSWSLSTTNSKFKTTVPYATYNGSNAGSTGTRAPSTGNYKTCNNIYCHSTVTGDGGVAGSYVASPAWDSTTTCASCHASQTSTYTGKHQTHTTAPYSYVCSTCHTGAGSETTKHSDQVVDVSINTTYGGTYAGSSTPGDAYSTCSNVYCHGNFTGGLNASPAWGGTAACGTCHGSDATTPPSNVNHPRHAGSTAVAGQLGLACAKCHPARAAKDGHEDLSVQWDLDRTDAKFGSTAAYRTLELGSTGTKAPSGSYGTCSSVYCHSSVQSGNGTGAPLSYDTPTWGAASVTCDSCHGQGTGTNDGAPSTGSHPVHVQTYAYTCAVCHSGLGEDVASHANGTINLAFDSTTAGASATYTTKGTSFAPQSAAFQTCTTTKCHGDSSNTSADTGTWGTNLSGADACTVCHGTKTTAADGAAAVINRAPGGNATGVDTNGTLGTPTRSVYPDPEVGAHDGHLRGIANISNPIACDECHAVPAVSVAGIKGHLDGTPADMTWGTLATTGSAPGGFDTATHTCSNIYCHNEAYFTTANHTDGGSDTTPTWNDSNYFGDNVPPLTSTECGRCHFYDGSDCSSCHYVSAPGDFVNADDLSFAAGNKGLHINGAVTATVTCVGCHSGTKGTRRAITGEFGQAWGHHDNTVTDADCVVCHMEGTSVANPVRSAAHAGVPGGTVDLRDPDLGTAIPSAAAVFARNLGSNTLETFAVSIQNNHCLKCHDSNGANYLGAGQTGTDGSHTPSNPFVTGVAPLNVDAHFNTANASFHPVKGVQNNTYCNATTMEAPWNSSTHYLITCFDCHAANGATGLQNSTVVAHGASDINHLRGAYNRTAGQPTALCIACHKTTTYWTGTTAPAGSAFSTAATTADTETHPNTAGTTSRHVVGETFFNGCISCHSSAGADAAQPARPRAAEDTHGYNTLAGGGNWATIAPATAGAPPFAFFRATNAITSWRPRSWTGQTAPTAGSCNGTNMCGRGESTYAYQPGGAY